MVGKRRSSEDGSGESEARVTAAELSASEQPTDHHCSAGLSSSSQSTAKYLKHLSLRHWDGATVAVL